MGLYSFFPPLQGQTYRREFVTEVRGESADKLSRHLGVISLYSVRESHKILYSEVWEKKDLKVLCSLAVGESRGGRAGNNGIMFGDAVGLGDVRMPLIGRLRLASATSTIRRSHKHLCLCVVVIDFFL